MDEIDVLCINCEDLIPSSQLEYHSHTCTKPIFSSDPQSDEDELANTNKKLIKIKCSLESWATNNSPSEFVYFLIRQCSEIISIKFLSLENLNLCLSINEGLKVYQDKVDNMFLVIYLERIKVCAKFKAKLMLELIRKDPVEKTASLFDNYDTNDLSKITEERESKETEPEGFHISVINSFQLKNIENSSRNYSFASSFMDSECQLSKDDDLKKKFYSKCINYKFRNQNLSIQISSLYNLARSKQIPKEKWDEFIKEQLSYPN